MYSIVGKEKKDHNGPILLVTMLSGWAVGS